MINWLNLLFNTIWIIALALALAMISMAYYQAKQRAEKMGSLLNTPKFSVPLNMSGALFCLGMALTSERWWEILLWIVLLGMFFYQGYKISKLNIKS